MSLSQELTEHALALLVDFWQTNLRDVYLRRAVSASYYALFHRLSGDAAALIAPNVAPQTSHRIVRWFEHAEIRKVCVRFAKPILDQPLRDLIGNTASPDLLLVAKSFIKLQEARHSADYDLSYTFTWVEANELVQQTLNGLEAWERIQHSAEANIFILSLLMWKNWDKERP